MLNEEIQHTVLNYDKVIGTLDTMKDVVAYSPRVKLFAMAQSDWAALGLVIKGVDPGKEKKVSELNLKMIEGEYLGNKYKIPSIIIGSKVAETLKLLNFQVTSQKLDSIDRTFYPQSVIQGIAKIGDKRFRKDKDFRQALKENLNDNDFEKYSDKLIKYFSFYRMNTSIRLTVQGKDGTIQNPVFKVRGIFKTSNTMFDGINAFVDREELNQYTGLSDSEVQEIAIISKDNETGIVISDRLAKYLPENNVLSWRKLSPEIAMYTDFMWFLGYIYVGIFLFALAFGIINTMLMSVLERFKELGMLMAIGMNKVKVFMMIMLESIFLSLTGGALGLIISGVVTHILGKTGIDFSIWAEGLEAMGYSSIIYPEISFDNYVVVTLLVILTGMIASIWPARRTLKLNPAEALRTE